MPSDKNKIFEDFAKIAGAAVDTAMHSASSAKSQFDSLIDDRLDQLLRDRQLVLREEFEVLKEGFARIKLENDDLRERIKELEAKNK